MLQSFGIFVAYFLFSKNRYCPARLYIYILCIYCIIVDRRRCKFNVGIGHQGWRTLWSLNIMLRWFVSKCWCLLATRLEQIRRNVQYRYIHMFNVVWHNKIWSRPWVINQRIYLVKLEHRQHKRGFYTMAQTTGRLTLQRRSAVS